MYTEYWPLANKALKTVGNIGDIAGCGATPVAQVSGVNASGVVLAEGLVDGLLVTRISLRDQVALEVLRSSVNHGADLLLQVRQSPFI